MIVLAESYSPRAVANSCDHADPLLLYVHCGGESRAAGGNQVGTKRPQQVRGRSSLHGPFICDSAGL